MDPLTAIGLVSNIIGFVDFGVKLFNNARETYDSVSGATENSLFDRSMAEKMQTFSDSLIPPGGVSGKDKAICDLAGECRSLAQDILTLLDKMKPKDSSSRGSSFVGAMKMMKYDKRKGELQARLATCQQQLGLHLSHATSSEIKKDLNALVASSKKNGDRMAQLQKQIEDLHEMSKALSAENKAQLSGLLNISEDAYKIVLSKRLLSHLIFKDMNTRFDNVALAHDGTFQWIFDDDLNADPGDLHREQLRQSFNSWLSSGDGIFHIAGKLGSGKSTLMKLLYRDRRTKARLREWAGNRKLIIAQFFFWNQGSRLQKSTEGLLRSLLYGGLKSAPELVAEVLPKQWTEIKSMPLQAQTKSYFPLEDLQAAFDRLIQCGAERYRICFFIDGLDEYDASRDDDYVAMVERLCSWSGSPGGNIKFCVSSREHNVFMNRFPDSQRIRMQDLTHPDMECFIRDKLDFVKRRKELKQLVRLISWKSSGVFLWVALVIARLRDLNENGENILKRLIKEIDDIPEELEGLFTHLLQSIHPSDRKRAYRTFAIVQRFNEEGDGDYLAIALADYYYIDDCLENSPDESISALRKFDKTSHHERLVQARKMLMGTCKGFLESTETPRSENEEGYEEWFVSFTHRSVPEFLQSFKSKDRKKYLKDFCLETAISRFFLLHIRNNALEWDDYHKHEWLSTLSLYLMSLRHTAKISKKPFFFEDQLESALARHECMDVRADGYYGEIGFSTMDGYEYPSIATLEPKIYTKYMMCRPLHIAALIGNFAYVRWKIIRDPLCIENALNNALLIYCVYDSLMKEKTNDVILGDGLSPLTLTKPTTLSPYTYTESLMVDKGVEICVWQHLVLSFIVSCNHSYCNKTAEAIFWERFLESGADTHLTISLPSNIDGGKHAVKLILGKEKRQVGLVMDFDEDIQEFMDGIDQEGEDHQITLADIFNRWDFPNKERLVSLAKLHNRLSSDGADAIKSNDVTHDDISLKEMTIPPEISSTEQTTNESTIQPEEAETDFSINAKDKESVSEKPKWSFMVIYLLGLLSAVLVMKLLPMIFG